MLVKQFLSENEKNKLLSKAKTIVYTQHATGNNAFVYNITSSESTEIDDLIYKANKILLNDNKNYRYNNKYSFLKITNNGWVSSHCDNGYKNVNILLQKPKEGGVILHGNKQVLMNELDAYILDANIKHGISSIKSDDEYYSLILWYKI